MTLETLIRDFLSAIIGHKVTLIRDWEWNCFPTGKVCTISFKMDGLHEHTPAFIAACQSINPAVNQYLEITLTLAHEAGHWLTRAKYNPLHDEYQKQVETCTENEYYYLPAEYEASRAGIEWIINHPHEVKEFEKNWRTLLTSTP